MFKKFVKKYCLYILIPVFTAVVFACGFMIGKDTITTATSEKEYVNTDVDGDGDTDIMDVAIVKKKLLDQKQAAVDLGEFKITAYCPCEKCCGKNDGITATGATATAGRTVAVDPNVIPYGTQIIINGHTYTAEDTGGAIKGNRVDICFNTHDEAINYGVQYARVYRK